MRRRSDRDLIGARARALNAQAGGGRLPPLLFFTDPHRTPDPAAVAARLPRGAAVVFRHFGAKDREETGRKLAAICRRRGLTLLIAADPALARRLRADGVHLPERLAAQARRLKRKPWLVTVAVHGPAAIREARGADALVLSPLFPSASPSAGKPLGPLRARALARSAAQPVYALGGISGETCRRVPATFAGLAAVDALRSGTPTPA